MYVIFFRFLLLMISSTDYIGLTDMFKCVSFGILSTFGNFDILLLSKYKLLSSGSFKLYNHFVFFIPQDVNVKLYKLGQFIPLIYCNSGFTYILKVDNRLKEMLGPNFFNLFSDILNVWTSGKRLIGILSIT